MTTILPTPHPTNWLVIQAELVRDTDNEQLQLWVLRSRQRNGQRPTVAIRDNTSGRRWTFELGEGRIWRYVSTTHRGDTAQISGAPSVTDDALVNLLDSAIHIH